jgi:hypothetical protein
MDLPSAIDREISATGTQSGLVAKEATAFSFRQSRQVIP